MVQTIFVLRIFINLHESLGESKKEKRDWNNRVMEYWNIGVGELSHTLFHCSTIPAFESYIPEPVRFKRGSSMSRSPSPRRLMPSTVTKMQRPGKSGSHQAVLM